MNHQFESELSTVTTAVIKIKAKYMIKSAIEHKKKKIWKSKSFCTYIFIYKMV